MIIIPPGDERRRPGRIRYGRGVKPPVGEAATYAQSLRHSIDDMMENQARFLAEWFEEYRDVPAALEMADRMRQEAVQIYGRQAGNTVARWFAAVDTATTNRFNNSIKAALGIDARSLLDQEIYDTIRTQTITANVGLIQTLPDDFFGEIKSAILADYQGLGFPGEAKSLAGRIQEITGTTKKHATLIARDQTSKLTGQMMEARQRDAGLDEYIWRTAGDQRVVGNPSGLYPKVKNPAIHGNHWKRNGQLFRWDDPPEDGPPGYGIGCRCVAGLVINPDRLRTQIMPVGILAG